MREQRTGTPLSGHRVKIPRLERKEKERGGDGRVWSGMAGVPTIEKRRRAENFAVVVIVTRSVVFRSGKCDSRAVGGAKRTTN